MSIESDLVQQFLLTVPDHPTISLLPEHWIVKTLAKQAANNLTDLEDPGFTVVKFNNQLRTWQKKLTLGLNRAFPLNDFLLDFLEVTVAMGINDPSLARSTDWAYHIMDLEHYGACFEGTPKQEEKRQKDREHNYHGEDGVDIIEYRDWPKSLGEIESIFYRDNIYYHTGRFGKVIIFSPTNELIAGQLTPTTIIEAYTLHILTRQEKLALKREAKI